MWDNEKDFDQKNINSKSGEVVVYLTIFIGIAFMGIEVFNYFFGG